MRVVNTGLVLFIGLLFGYILRDPSGRKAAPYVAVYPRASEAPAPPANYGLQESAPAARNKGAAPKARAAEPAARTDDTGEDFALPVKQPLETDYEVTYRGGEPSENRKPSEPPAVKPREPAAEPPPKSPDAPPDSALLKGAEEAFFKNPERYLNQYLEMELQMVLSRKIQGGWVLNLVHARGGKNVDYIYIEDDFLLGAQPDLRIGYFYNVSFKCGKGSANSGNKLLGINPSGKKAAWATGVSALE